MKFEASSPLVWLFSLVCVGSGLKPRRQVFSQRGSFVCFFQLQYFGLRYVTKKLQFRWVDLNKPLKKQLEKYAQTAHSATRSPRLYFGVMFYIAHAHKIMDDVAR